MTEKEEPDPVCFGDLGVVFPPGADGFRHTPASCMACVDRVACLAAAMKSTGGLKLREEFVDRAYESGMIGFIERWSRRKSLRLKREKLKIGQKGKER